MLDQLYPVIQPLLFRLKAERAHQLTMAALRLPLPGWLVGSPRPRPSLAVSLAGMHWPNPLGLAAGLDKNAHALATLSRLGFGAIEVGTVTPLPQPGNPRPRLFRLRSEQALINRMGFNNAGAPAMAQRLRRRHPRLPGAVPLGINIGKNKDTPANQAAADYLRCFELLAPLADYVVVNVSSPNTPGLRDLAQAGPLGELLATLVAARGQQPAASQPPIFVKVSPDHQPKDLDRLLAVLLSAGIEGIIATNTTTWRHPRMISGARLFEGGLSGVPLRPRAHAVLRSIRRYVGTRLPIIGVGGISGPNAAYERIRAGASALQVYTALVYAGPGLIDHILAGLEQRLQADGLASLEQAVGADAERGREV